MAICDLTITYERRTAVDFTMPFMTLGNKFHIKLIYGIHSYSQQESASYSPNR